MVRRSSRVAKIAATTTKNENKNEKKKKPSRKKNKKKKKKTNVAEPIVQRGAWILNKPEFRTSLTSTLSPMNEVVDEEGDSFPSSNKKLRRLISNATKNVYGKSLFFQNNDNSNSDSSDSDDNEEDDSNKIVDNSTAKLLKKSNFALHNGGGSSSSSNSSSSNSISNYNNDEYSISNNNYKKRNKLPHDVTRQFVTPKMTPEIQRDLEVIKMRSFADPKRFYKKSDSRRELPKEFQLGTIIEGNNEYKSARLTKKNRKQTIADELYSDKRVRKYTGRVFHETQRLNDNRKKKKRRK